MPNDDEHRIFEYAIPQAQSGGAGKIAQNFALWIVLPGFLLVVALILLVPKGTWYFGHHPQWVFEIDDAGIAFGHTDYRLSVGMGLVLFFKILFVGLPAWIVTRIVSKRQQ